MKTLTFSSFGNSDVLEYIDIPNPELKHDEILVEMKAIGLNFSDIYRRKGNYHLKRNPPFVAGYEGAGVVINTNNHSEFKIGDRVAFADVPFANAELVAININHVIPLPEAIDFETGASILLQGLTAHYLATDSHKTLTRRNCYYPCHCQRGRTIPNANKQTFGRNRNWFNLIIR